MCEDGRARRRYLHWPLSRSCRRSQSYICLSLHILTQHTGTWGVEGARTGSGLWTPLHQTSASLKLSTYSLTTSSQIKLTEGQHCSIPVSPRSLP